MSKISKVDFLYIGPDKAGSSWLYEYISGHPQCFIPECKDLYFFDRYFNKGFEWYLRFFDKSVDGQLSGEISHDYLYSKEAALRIKSHNQSVKLLTSLRNPADRSFSQYLYLIRSGMTNKDFWGAVSQFPEIIDNSYYYKHLSFYFAHFPRENIKVLMFDQLQSAPKDYADQVTTFLNVDLLSPLVTGEVRAAAKPRSYVVAKFFKFGALLVRNLGFPTIVGKLKHGVLAKVLYSEYRSTDKPKLSSSDRARLNQMFKDDVSDLGKLLDMDFIGLWLTRADSTPNSGI